MSTTPHRQGRAIIAVCTALVTLAVGLIVALMTAKSAEAERARADAEAMAAESRAMSEVAEQSAESNRAALEGTAESILKIADALDADDPNAARIYTIDALGAIVGELDDPAAALDMWSRIIDLTEELDEDIQRRVLGFLSLIHI